jgi:hypothetical protein
VAARQQRIAGGDRLQLQGDVGDDADDGDLRHQGGQQAALAVATADEVGDRRDAMDAGDADHLAQQHPREQHPERRAEIDRQEPQAGRSGPADAAEVGPGGAIDTHRQCIDPGVADDRASFARPRIAQVGDREKQHQVGERRGDDQRCREHGVSSSRPPPISAAQPANSASGGNRLKRTPWSHSVSSGKLAAPAEREQRAGVASAALDHRAFRCYS